MNQSDYTLEQMDDDVRKGQTPSCLISFLPIGTVHITDTLVANTWTKILVNTTAKKLRDWAVVDTGGGDYRYQFQGDSERSFRVGMTTGVSSAVLDNGIEFAMSNGTIGVDQDTLEDGCYSPARTKVANDISPLGLEGCFTSDPLDTIAVWVRSEKATKITFIGMSIVVIEVN